MTLEQDIHHLIRDLARYYAQASGRTVPDETHWSQARQRVEPLLRIARNAPGEKARWIPRREDGRFVTVQAVQKT